MQVSRELIAGGVKGNTICLPGGVPFAGAGRVGVEAKNFFSSFVARAGHELRCCDALLMRDAVFAATWLFMKNYRVGRAPATGLAGNYVSQIL
jgi:hypothetical protein